VLLNIVQNANTFTTKTTAPVLGIWMIHSERQFKNSFLQPTRVAQRYLIK
jgi:hypothetical protein